MDNENIERRKRSRVWIELAAAGDEMFANHCKATGDTAEDVARALDISPAALSLMRSGDRAFPGDVIIRATRLTGDPIMLHAADGFCNRLSVPSPTANDDNPVGIAELLDTFNDIAQAILEAEAPQGEGGIRVTMSEADKIKTHARLLQEELARVVIAVERRATNGGRARTLADA